MQPTNAERVRIPPPLRCARPLSRPSPLCRAPTRRGSPFSPDSARRWGLAHMEGAPPGRAPSALASPSAFATRPHAMPRPPPPWVRNIKAPPSRAEVAPLQTSALLIFNPVGGGTPSPPQAPPLPLGGEGGSSCGSGRKNILVGAVGAWLSLKCARPLSRPSPLRRALGARRRRYRVGASHPLPSSGG